MSTVAVYFANELIDRLKRYAEERKLNFSEACRELIELGFKVGDAQERGQSEESKRKQELEDKHTSYLLQILNIEKEILRCVFNKEATTLGGATAEEDLLIIKENVKNFIESYMGKNDGT